MCHVRANIEIIGVQGQKREINCSIKLKWRQIRTKDEPYLFVYLFFSQEK